MIWWYTTSFLDRQRHAFSLEQAAPVKPSVSSKLWHGLAKQIGRAREALQTRRELGKTVALLSQLNNHYLDDVGLRYEDIAALKSGKIRQRQPVQPLQPVQLGAAKPQCELYELRARDAVKHSPDLQKGTSQVGFDKAA